MVRVPMRLEGDRWLWDFERLEASITPRTKLLLLCNPHNPVGRVFSREELGELARIAAKHDLVICSDEIHCGLILDADKRHVPIATLGDDISARTITLMAASKTFNLPGLGCAFAVVSNPSLAQTAGTSSRRHRAARHGPGLRRDAGSLSGRRALARWR